MADYRTLGCSVVGRPSVLLKMTDHLSGQKFERLGAGWASQKRVNARAPNFRTLERPCKNLSLTANRTLGRSVSWRSSALSKVQFFKIGPLFISSSIDLFLRTAVGETSSDCRRFQLEILPVHCSRFLSQSTTLLTVLLDRVCSHSHLRLH